MRSTSRSARSRRSRRERSRARAPRKGGIAISRSRIFGLIGTVSPGAARSAVEDRPADVVPQPLVVEHELADRVRELVTLPAAFASRGTVAVPVRRTRTRSLDRIGGGAQLVGG